METQPTFQLIDFCGGGRLYETLAAVLRNSFGERFQSRSEKRLNSKSKTEFLTELETTNPRVVLLMIEQLEQAGDFIRQIKAKKHDSDVIVITEKCDAGQMFDLLAGGATDVIVTPITLAQQ